MPFELELTGMAYGGSAIGRHEGKVIFVPYGMVGERVLVEIVQDKGKFAQARIVEVLAPAESRIAPRCVHFGICGGCHWQHIEYTSQLELKQAVVQEQLARVGGFKNVIVHPAIPGPDAWHYRSHVSLHTTHDERFGFVAADNVVIPIEECHIVRPELWEMWQQLPAQLLPENQRLRLQVGDNEKFAVRINAISDDTSSTSSHEAKIHYTIHGRKFQVTAGSFFQVNLAQAEVLVKVVMEKLSLQAHERVLDLYSGVGLFTAFLAERAKHVTAIEISPTAVQDAKVNLADFQNVELVVGKAENVLKKQKFDAVVTDPPRTGMKPNAIDAVIRAKPQKILYVSCDPTTLARDAKRFSEHGYHLLEVQPVDMFPQTYHIEAVALLTL